jgi:hypothetical protein
VHASPGYLRRQFVISRNRPMGRDRGSNSLSWNDEAAPDLAVKNAAPTQESVLDAYTKFS